MPFQPSTKPEKAPFANHCGGAFPHLLIMNHPFLNLIDVGDQALPVHLETLQVWLDRLPPQFKAEVAAPKGTMLCGIPGSGKGIIAAVIAATLQRPLFRLDPACDPFAVAEIVGLLGSMSPCVLLVNEPGEQHHGLVHWLLDQPRPVFVVATTIRPDKLPSGFFRRDLFDTAWHLGLPTSGERCKIWSQQLDPHGSPVAGYDCVRLAQCTPRCTFAEIRAMHDCVVRSAAGKVPSENDFLGAAVRYRPLAHELDDEVSILREWSARRADRAGVAALTDEVD